MGFAFYFGWLAVPDAGWLWHTLAFIGLWTTGLYTVQAKTLLSPQDSSPQFARWAPRIRLSIDVCFTTAITMFLSPVGLMLVSVIVFLAHLGLMVHFQYFLRPVSALTMYHNWREGAKASSHSVRARTRGLNLIFGASLLVKLALLATAPDPGVGRGMLWAVGTVAAVGYVGLMALASWIDPLDRILTTRGIGRLGMIRGYFVTWLAEFFYLGKRQVLESAIRQQQVTSDALTPIETSIPIRRQLVIIQAESLDFNVLGCQANGQEVTPFLNRLRERSLFYRISAARYIGSADADFVMLNSVMPSMHIITYNIPNYPYRNTLPQFLGQFGYRTEAFHGNTGNFYNRRAAFEKMGFAEIHFEEEMIERDGLPQIAWGIEDRQVLDLSARRLQEASGKVCHFIITLTTHTPYNLLGCNQRDVFPQPQSIAENYLNNMRYLDNQISAYIGSLSSATVVIYSDHPADPAVAPDFMPNCQAAREYVPCFVYDTDSDLATLQRTRESGPAVDGSLTLLDIGNFLRAQVAAGNDQPPLATSGSGGFRVTSGK